MAYSLDLRKRVVEYIENGGPITRAATLFKVGRTTIYRWLGRQDLKPTQVKRRRRKLDYQALEKDVAENPSNSHFNQHPVQDAKSLTKEWGFQDALLRLFSISFSKISIMRIAAKIQTLP